MTTNNPYRRAAGRRVQRAPAVTTASARSNRAFSFAPRTGTLRTASTEPLFNAGGDVNASSKRELMSMFAAFMKDPTLLEAASHEYQAENDPQYQAQLKASQAEDDEFLCTALLSPDQNAAMEALEITAATYGKVIRETMGRQAFARQYLSIENFGQGVDARWEVEKRDVVAYMMDTAGQAIPCEPRDYVVYPSDYYIHGSVLISDMDIAHSRSGIVDRKYNELLEQMWRTEDTYFTTLARASAPKANTPVAFNTFTPQVFQLMRRSITDWALSVFGCIISNDIWDDIVASTDFSSWFDPVHKHDLIRDGMLGSLLNIPIRTDGYRYPNLRVLDRGEVFFFAPPGNLGGLGQRTELTTRAINRFNESIPKRGWYAQIIEHMLITNARGICRGKRI